jgi:hypothetical protein
MHVVTNPDVPEEPETGVLGSLSNLALMDLIIG